MVTSYGGWARKLHRKHNPGMPAQTGCRAVHNLPAGLYYRRAIAPARGKYTAKSDLQGNVVMQGWVCTSEERGDVTVKEVEKWVARHGCAQCKEPGQGAEGERKGSAGSWKARRVKWEKGGWSREETDLERGVC